MTYEEAKQTALDAMTDYPDSLSVTISSSEGRNFILVNYSKRHNEGSADMVICEDGWICYKAWYEDLTLKPVRGISDYTLLDGVQRDQLYEFLCRQIDIVAHITD
jgi:hypothetical protein